MKLSFEYKSNVVILSWKTYRHWVIRIRNFRSFGQVFLCKHKREDKFYVVKKLRMMEL